MIVSDKYRIIFYHIPKTGGSSVTDVLIRQYEGRRLFGKHCNVHNGLRLIEKEKDYFSISLVRNPFARMVSWYQHILAERQGDPDIIHPGSFREFLFYYRRTKEHSKMVNFQYDQNQIDFLCSGILMPIDYIMQLEEIDTNWRILCKVKDMPYHPMPHIKKGIDLDYKDFYDDILIQYIKTIFKKDLEYFDYDFN